MYKPIMRKRNGIIFRKYGNQGRIQEYSLEGAMASAEREPIMGVWGLCPQRGPGAKPLVRGQSPPEAERFWCCHTSEMALNCYVYELFYGH